ncbi:hypothetical protein T01_1795 [Trichinella spiralis]|uniref:Uncharacterized protein n=1 Tax=Trichinella spiralis TaxID=6334 RepID=A0A0V1BC83_TRISP|nr:hypothetical protein T01_1795 [Trichinella spiralis]
MVIFERMGGQGHAFRRTTAEATAAAAAKAKAVAAVHKFKISIICWTIVCHSSSAMTDAIDGFQLASLFKTANNQPSGQSRQSNDFSIFLKNDHPSH